MIDKYKRAAAILRNQISTYVFKGTESHEAIMLGASYVELAAALPKGEAERVLKAAAERQKPTEPAGCQACVHGWGKHTCAAECACPGDRHHLQTCPLWRWRDMV